VNDEKKVGLAKEYKEKVEKELTELCDTVLALLNDYLIPNANGDESKVSHDAKRKKMNACQLCSSRP
jgi:hypothetical protein